MRGKPQIIIYITLLLVILLLSGCARLKWLDDKLGEGFQKIENASFEEIFEFEVDNIKKQEEKQESVSTSTIIDLVGKITPEQKEKIENWLIKNSLNRYGDPEETEYSGGTPLINEETGESIERYYYILSKNAELLELFNNSNTTK